VDTVDRKSWSGRFAILSPWFSDIMNVVKRDCKSEHLRLDPLFVRQHFGGVPIHRITFEEMRAVYLQQVIGGHDRLAEFVTNRWLFRNMEMYRFFEESLQKISTDFEKIAELTNEQAEPLLAQALQKFDVEKVFCFIILNEVAVPNDCFEKLQRQALEKLAERQESEPQEGEKGDLLRQEMDRIKERHEKKIQEMTKKHQQEIQRLQKEISSLRAELSKATVSRVGV
jgi:hypothetical protein